MNCPYCEVKFSIDGVNADHSFPHFGSFRPWGGASQPDPNDKDFSITSHKCPECRGQIMWLNELAVCGDNPKTDKEVIATTLLYPRTVKKALPASVPSAIAEDFREALGTLEVSPKASAALSRRCLQNVIREQESIVRPNLSQEVRDLLALKKLPLHLAEDLDAIRVIGNFAAHPIKDQHTGDIVEVEPGEAEWTLQVLGDLIRFYYEDELERQARRDALNAKLRSAGRNPMQIP